jgi:CBS domain-containing protein
VVRALAARGSAVLQEPVSAIHTTQVRSVAPDAAVEEVERLMTEHRFRHVPVLDGGTLVGVVSIGDVVKHRIDELEIERKSLEGYITGERI